MLTLAPRISPWWDSEAKFRRLLKEALDSGMLVAKVGILKHPGKAGSMSRGAHFGPVLVFNLQVPAPQQGEPPHEMEIMKAHLCEVRLVRHDVLSATAKCTQCGPHL